MAKLYADYEPVTFFPKNSNVYQDFYSVPENFVGVNFFEIDINTGKDGGVYGPYFLRRLDKLQTEIEAWS